MTEPPLAERIARYRSLTATEAAEDFAKDVTVAARPANWARAKAFLFALVHLASFCEEVGVGLTPAVCLSEPVIERFCATGLVALSGATRRTVRSNLVAVRRAQPGVGPEPARLARERSKLPYAPDEVAGYLRLAMAQPTAARRHHAAALICLSAGAGLVGADLRGVRGGDIISLGDARVVDVIGRRARRVPVLTRYGQTLAEAASFAGGGFVIGGTSGVRRNVTTPLISSLHAGPDSERLDVGRLRATWLCEVAQLIGLPTFMAAAGIACSQRLGDLVARAAPLGDDDAVSLLGGRSC